MTVNRQLRFTPEAASNLTALKKSPRKGLHKQVLKTLALLETNPQHTSLNIHRFYSLDKHSSKKTWEAYVQNKTPGAHRIFFHYGPDETKNKKRIAIITIIAITPHP